MAAVIFGVDHGAMTRLAFRAFFAARPRLAGAAEPTDSGDADDAAAEAAASCGWYDSSNDLKSGLDVVELQAPFGWPDTEPVAWPLG